MEFKVLGKRLLVQEYDKEKVSKGGIIIPDTAEKQLNNIEDWFGVVIGIGDEINPDLVSIGDIVVFDPTTLYPGFVNPNSQKQAIFVNLSNILSIVKP